MKWRALLACTTLLLSAPLLQAAERNDLPSCYEFAKLSQYRPQPSGRELIIIIDQTVQLPKDLKDSTYSHALRYVKPGDSVRLYQFSAYLPGNYMKLMYTGQLEGRLGDKVRDDIGMNSLRQLDACLSKQVDFFQKSLGQKMVESFAKPGEDIAKSEIFFSLKQIGDDIATRPAPEKVLLLVSDMLENSDFGSFYANNQIRSIDPSSELKKVEQKKLFADLGGAKVYVLGAGLVPGSIKNGYRSGSTVQKLESFWGDYLSQSNAHLVSFGAPSLTVDLQ
ncbi:hypothetical protein [Pseudomonas sp. efr-133-TYG-103a]|uniref:hypothetical protein n=1 Tax=Pseudomonas sp. efr-133-TYG-103a TaxID=3040308 RepID=UPI002552D357|nr:hypothetical protein [Pseudomonas sp. efr-133-TYG-103a]